MANMFGGGGDNSVSAAEEENRKARKAAEEEKAELEKEREARKANSLARRMGRRSLLNKDTREKGVKSMLGTGRDSEAA